jgi:hypothetical protein
VSAELLARLDAAAPRLCERVLAEMYTNPFWDARFGERGRTHSAQDGRFHVQYLREALTSGDDGVLTRYATWLQQTLTTRGMCTRHLAENFARLARAIEDEGWPDGARATAPLVAAIEALRYPDGAARALQDAAPALAELAAARLYDAHPEWLERTGDAGRRRCVDDLRYHLDYTADALALGTLDHLVAYAGWIAGFLEQHRVPRAHLVEAFAALGAVVAEHAPPIPGAVDALTRARAAVEAP